MTELTDLTNGALKLSGVASRNLRFLINRCQRTLVAIPGYGVPLLRGMLPLAVRSQGVLDALLTLSDRLHFSDTQMQENQTNAKSPKFLDRSDQKVLDNYHEALSTLQSSLVSIQSGITDAEEAIAMSIILLIFGFPGHRIWSVHLNGLIALIQDPGVPALHSPSLSFQASKLAAHAEITAFSLGRIERSQRLWLSWRIHPLEGKTTCGGGHNVDSDRAHFSDFEVSTGYPESLVTIIALVSAVVEDAQADHQPPASPISCYIHSLANHQRMLQDMESSDAQTLLFSPGPRADGFKTGDILATEALIAQWQPPLHPTDLAVSTSLALATAWSVMQKAALLYLWRGGFTENIFADISAKHAHRVQQFLQEAPSGIELVMQAAEQHDIMVANALLWPLTVLGNECAVYPDLQGKVLEYLDRLSRHFPIHHSQIVAALLQKLWKLAAEPDVCLDTTPSGTVSLQRLALQDDACIPLL